LKNFNSIAVTLLAHPPLRGILFLISVSSMKKSTLLATAFLLVFANSCSKQDDRKPLVIEKPDPASLDQFIQDKMLSQGEFLWEWASPEQIWTALSNADHVLSVGYQPEGEQNVQERIHLIDIHSAAWTEARNKVLQDILLQERALQPELTEGQLLAFAENGRLPVFDVYVRNPATIEMLRQSGMVRYAEPIGYEPFIADRAVERSGSGCDSNTPASGLAAGSDYTNIAPGCKQSWNHPFHKITEAWNNSTGAGKTVMIIDTGASDDQDNLDEAFNQGYSSGRVIEKLVTLTGTGETPHDQCGHGTSMIGACAAPRGTDGAATGIAYNADIVSVRAAADVYLDESREVVGVSNAFTIAGNSSSIQIVSMSMGRIITSNQIKDAIVFAHNTGDMIFCAAGTSFWWTSWFWGVIFPASLNQCIAVTGIKDNLTSACSNCHSGSKVDFVLVMQKVSNGRNPLSLAQEGNAPSTVGGSSVATSSTAGIAALIWAKNPGWTRQQVFDKMKTSSNYWPNRNGSFGWGRVNAQLATQ
jgi:hypothetical protein